MAGGYDEFGGDWRMLANTPGWSQYEWGGKGRSIDDRGYYVPGTSGREMDVARYRGMGERRFTGPTIDTSFSNQARGDQVYALGEARSGMGLAADAASGATPSAAQIYGGKLIDDSINSQMSMAASTRGGPTAIGGAQRAAAFQGAQTQQAGARDLAALRAQEMAQGRDQYLGAANMYGGMGSAMRGQDFQQAYGQAGLDADTLGRNMQNEQFYEGMGFDVNKTALGAAQDRENYQSQAWGRGRELKLKEEEADWDKTKSYASMGGSFLGGIFSDIRAKGQVYSLGPVGEGGVIRKNPYGDTSGLIRENPYGAAPAQGPSDFQRVSGAFGDALSSFGGGRPGINPTAAYAPRGRHWSDRNTKYVVSDERGKVFYGEDGRAYVSNGKGEGLKPMGEKPRTMGDFRRDTPQDQARVKRGVEDAAGREADAMMAGMRASLGQGAAVARDEGEVDETPGWLADYMTTQEDPRLAQRYVVSDQRAKTEAFSEGLRMGQLGAARQDPREFNEEGLHGIYAGPTPKEFHGKEEDPLASANRAQAGSAYTYKPEFAAASGQAPGEMNVGPMAQNMAADPVAGTAVKQDPQTGLLVLDDQKLQKVQSAGIGSLQAQVDAIKNRIKRLGWGK